MSVPHAIDAYHFKGPAGTRNYEGSVAWYRASFDAPQTGTYALRFDSANSRARVWIDGKPYPINSPIAVRFIGWRLPPNR